MGLFTSFLCCGSDASKDADDKYQKQSPSRSNPQTTKNQELKLGSSRNQAETTAANLKNGAGSSSPIALPNTEAQTPVKPVADEENSVNESDTLTMANDEAQRLDHSQVGSGLDNNTAANSDANESSPINPSDIITSVSNDNNVNANNEDEEVLGGRDTSDVASTLDLSAIQENQSFHPETGFLLGKKDIQRFGNKKCLVLDLDETLVHSSFKYLRTADFVIPVEIDDNVHHVYVIKRPGVDEFLKKVGQWYEVVVFTASVAKYGDPLLNKLDIHHAVHQRLFRDSCYSYQGNFIKNLSQLGRPLEDSIIIDNSPASYIFHPQHSIPISSWFSDTHDNELLDLLPLLEDLSKPNVDDVSLVLDITI